MPALPLACSHVCLSVSLSVCFARCGRDYCDSDEVKGVADAMVKNGMKDLGWEYINLDG